MGRKAAFLDRDGTILVERGHVCDPAHIELLPGAASAIRRLQDNGWKVLVVTNQSHVARGLITESELEVIQQAFRRRLVDEGAAIDGIYHCPHHPDGQVAAYTMACDCRKPRPGLLLRAAAVHDVDLHRSVMVGDHEGDLAAGEAAGVKYKILVRTGHGARTEAAAHAADHVADDLQDAVDWILDPARG